jgi:hypothetical protein
MREIVQRNIFGEIWKMEEEWREHLFVTTYHQNVSQGAQNGQHTVHRDQCRTCRLVYGPIPDVSVVQFRIDTLTLLQEIIDGRSVLGQSRLVRHVGMDLNPLNLHLPSLP